MLFLCCSVLSKICLKEKKKGQKDLKNQNSPFQLVSGLSQELCKLPSSRKAVHAQVWSIALHQQGRDGPHKMPKGRISVLETGDKGVI